MRRRCRIFAVARALRDGMSVDEIHELTRIDRWFLHAMAPIVADARTLAKLRAPARAADMLREAKRLGFSDSQHRRL